MELELETQGKVQDKVIELSSNAKFKEFYSRAISLLLFFSQHWENNNEDIVKEKLQRLCDSTNIRSFDIEELANSIVNSDVDRLIKLGHEEDALKLLELFIQKANPNNEIMDDGIHFAQKYYIFHRPDQFVPNKFNLDMTKEKYHKKS